jgi:hypothetical protein
MGFNRRKIEDQRRQAAEKAARRATDAQVLEDAELVRLSRTSIADEMREEHRWRVLGE